MNNMEMKEAFRNLYKQMAESKDIDQMMVFGDAFKQMYDKVADMHPEIAAATLGVLGAIEYNNYLTSEEAYDILSHLQSDDGSPMPRWKVEEIRSFLAAHNLPSEEKPYYNLCAMAVTMNMLYSDYVEPMAELLGTSDNAKLAMAFYKLARKKLKDVDRPRFIRSYFGLK